jgi:hypothetical protein
MTGPQRGARHQRSRAPRAWVFGTAGLAAAAAVVVVAVVLLTSGGTPGAARPTPLATNITSSQAVGLANLGPPPKVGGSSAGTASLLAQAEAGLAFTPGSGGETVQPSQQWQADQMGGGAYILVFTPDGECLTAAGTKRRPTAVLARCDLGLGERWSHPYLGTDPAGRGYWQLRSAADGRCLAVGGTQPDGGVGVAMQPCSSSMPWQQLITFFTAF